MRSAIDALITSSEPISVRLRSAEERFRDIDPESDLLTELERNLWHRIASSLVSGGAADNDPYSQEAVAASIAAMDDDIAVLVARDMLRLYELTATCTDDSLRWPTQRWPDDDREPRSPDSREGR
jgi:hypothetical protein